MDKSKMTKEDIIRMAQECKLIGMRPHLDGIYQESLEHFAALVAAAEREAILKEGWRKCAEGQKTTQFCAITEQAVLAEREACAKLCEDMVLYTGYDCAAAIRARGQA